MLSYILNYLFKDKKVTRSKEDELIALKETAGCYSFDGGVAFDRKDSMYILKRIMSINYDNIEQNELVNFIESLKYTSKDFFDREDDLGLFFTMKLKKYILKNHKDASLKALMYAISKVEIPNFDKEVKKNLKNNSSNKLNIIVVLKFMYEKYFKYIQINSEKEIINNSLKSPKALVNMTKKRL